MYEAYGIIGYPVGHSLSPLMHNLAFKTLNIKAVYGAFEVKPQDLEEAIRGIKALSIKGVSVTIPHKEKTIKFLDEVEEVALEIGAVNTILNEYGKLKGFNTDWIGFLKALEEEKVELVNKKVVIIGAGGSSKAILYAIKRKGAREIEIYNRTYEKALELAKKFEVEAKPWEELKKASGDLIVQTTSVGLKSWESPVDEKVLAQFEVAFDLVYFPLKTKFLSLAENLGCKIIDGLKMLLYQGVEQFRIWIKKEPPINLMKEVIYKEVSQFKVGN